MKRRSLLLAAASAVVCLAGCSFSSSKPSSAAPPTASTSVQPSQPPVAYITPSDINAQPTNSPEAALLTFWSNLQIRNLYTAYNETTVTFHQQFSSTLAHFGTYIMADYAHWLVRPKILSSTLTGNQANVVVTYPVPGGNAPRESFVFLRNGTSWLLAYDFYLASRLQGK